MLRLHDQDAYTTVGVIMRTRKTRLRDALGDGLWEGRGARSEGVSVR